MSGYIVPGSMLLGGDAVVSGVAGVADGAVDDGVLVVWATAVDGAVVVGAASVVFVGAALVDADSAVVETWSHNNSDFVAENAQRIFGI